MPSRDGTRGGTSRTNWRNDNRPGALEMGRPLAAAHPGRQQISHGSGLGDAVPGSRLTAQKRAA